MGYNTPMTERRVSEGEPQPKTLLEQIAEKACQEFLAIPEEEIKGRDCSILTFINTQIKGLSMSKLELMKTVIAESGYKKSDIKNYEELGAETWDDMFSDIAAYVIEKWVQDNRLAIIEVGDKRYESLQEKEKKRDGDEAYRLMLED